MFALWKTSFPVCWSFFPRWIYGKENARGWMSPQMSPPAFPLYSICTKHKTDEGSRPIFGSIFILFTQNSSMHCHYVTSHRIQKDLYFNNSSSLEALFRWLFACLLYTCGDAFVDFGDISFQRDPLSSKWNRWWTIYPHCSLLAVASPRISAVT